MGIRAAAGLAGGLFGWWCRAGFGDGCSSWSRSVSPVFFLSSADAGRRGRAWGAFGGVRARTLAGGEGNPRVARADTSGVKEWAGEEQWDGSPTCFERRLQTEVSHVACGNRVFRCIKVFRRCGGFHPLRSLRIRLNVEFKEMSVLRRQRLSIAFSGAVAALAGCQTDGESEISTGHAPFVRGSTVQAQDIASAGCVGIAPQNSVQVWDLRYHFLFQQDTNCSIVMASQVCDTWIAPNDGRGECVGPIGLSIAAIDQKDDPARVFIRGRPAEFTYLTTGVRGDVEIFEGQSGVRLFEFPLSNALLMADSRPDFQLGPEVPIPQN